MGKIKENKIDGTKTVMYNVMIAVPFLLARFYIPYLWKKLVEKLKGE